MHWVCSAMMKKSTRFLCTCLEDGFRPKMIKSAMHVMSLALFLLLYFLQTCSSSSQFSSSVKVNLAIKNVHEIQSQLEFLFFHCPRTRLYKTWNCNLQNRNQPLTRMLIFYIDLMYSRNYGYKPVIFTLCNLACKISKLSLRSALASFLQLTLYSNEMV